MQKKKNSPLKSKKTLKSQYLGDNHLSFQSILVGGTKNFIADLDELEHAKKKL